MLLSSLLTGCGIRKVPAGYVGIKVYLLGSDKGVDVEELPVGRYFLGINEELYLFPMFTQNYVWTKAPTEGSKNDESITFQTKEGMNVSADVGISYHIKPDMASVLFQRYRKGIDEITDVFLRNKVRDAFVRASQNMSVEAIYGEQKSDLLDEVMSIVRTDVDTIGISIEQIYLVGKLRFPVQVVDALNAKIEATQRAQQRENEVREARAEAEKRIAKAEGEAQSILRVAKANAEANIILAKSLTPELIEYKKIEAWDGVLPTVTSANSMPLIALQ